MRSIPVDEQSATAFKCASIVPIHMFKRKSAVHKKSKKKRRAIDPRKRMLILQALIGLLICVVLALLVTGLWYGTRVQFLTITTVEVEGGETISYKLVEQKVRESLTGVYLGLIPRRFAWWYPQQDILDAISVIPRLKNPEVERVSGTAIKIRFSEYQPYALWCPDRSGDGCLFFDENGYAFVKAPKLTGSAFLRYRTLGREVSVGSTVAEFDQIKKMESFAHLMEENLKFSVNQIETDTAEDVFYILSGGGEIKATLKDDTNQVFNNLQTVLTSPEFKHIRPGNFQYIDLRFGNKVFVNEEDPNKIPEPTEEIVDVVTDTASTSAEIN